MTIFDDRNKVLENKYAHDQEFQFKVNARRNKLLGLWAAEKLGRADKDAYAKEVVMADFEKPGDEDVLEKVLADFTTANIAITPEEIRAEMNRLLRVAAEQIA